MFGRKKKEKFYVELNPAEVKIFVTALISFRNKCMPRQHLRVEEEKPYFKAFSGFLDLILHQFYTS